MVNLGCYAVEEYSVRRLVAAPQIEYTCMRSASLQNRHTYSAVKQKQKINI